MRCLQLAFKQVKTKKISEVIRDQLEEMIRSGALQPGEKLDSVEKLSASFEVSRSAVREALSALRAIGLVTIRQGEGTFVNKYDFSSMVDPVGKRRILSNKEKLELFQVRKIIEVGAASLAAESRTSEQLQHIKDALDRMEVAEEGLDLGEKADVDFHLAIAAAASNDILYDMMTKLSNTFSLTMYESRKKSLFSEVQSLKRLHHEHEQIYKAIKAKDASAANQAMMDHLVKVEQILLHDDRQS